MFRFPGGSNETYTKGPGNTYINYRGKKLQASHAEGIVHPVKRSRMEAKHEAAMEQGRTLQEPGWRGKFHPQLAYA